MAEASHLVTREERGVSVVGFAEPTVLDAYHVAAVGKELMDLVEKGGRRHLVLDLKPIAMLSSQTLRLFLNLRQKLSEVGGRVVISGIDPKLYRVFKITNLQTIFEFYDTVETAVASFGSERAL
jgi:anti-sigma B factor antagonist